MARQLFMVFISMVIALLALCFFYFKKRSAFDDDLFDFLLIAIIGAAEMAVLFIIFNLNRFG